MQSNTVTVYDLFDDEVFEVIEVQSKRIHRISPRLSLSDECLSYYKSIDISKIKVLIVVPFNTHHNNVDLYREKGIYYMSVVQIDNGDTDIDTRLYRFFLPVAMIILTKLIQYLRDNKMSIVMAGHGPDVDTLLTNDLKYDNCVGVRQYSNIFDLDEDTVNRLNDKLVAIRLSPID